MTDLNFQNPNFSKIKSIKKLSKNVYLYKNFVNEDFYNSVMNFLNNQDKEILWKQHGIYKIGDNDHDWFYDKVSLPFQEMHFLLNELEKIMNPEFWGINHLVINKLESGQKFSKLDYKPIGPFQTDASWVSGTYFGDWEGGEICFPEEGIEVRVKPGDLIIFSPKNDCPFYVKEVTSGTRYCHYGIYYKHHGWLMP